MNWPYPRIVAHRGGGTLYPENTLGAIRMGAAGVCASGCAGSRKEEYFCHSVTSHA